MAVTILESNMLFGEYKDEQVFQIEKSIQYNEKLKYNGIRTILLACTMSKCRKPVTGIVIT